MKPWISISLLGIATFSWVSCRKEVEPSFLGSGVVESATNLLSSPQTGTLLWIKVHEGQQIAQGDTLALVDTMLLHWQKMELEAGDIEIAALARSRDQEIKAIRSESEGLRKELLRIENLKNVGSATEQQWDKTKTQLKALGDREKAAIEGQGSLTGRKSGIWARHQGLSEQMRRCWVISPYAGTVATLYRQSGEISLPNQPILELRKTDTVNVDFFLEQPYLASVALGKAVHIRLDGPESPTSLKGFISFIADEAEFAPKNIQTRESRNESVFRIRVKAENESGLLKQGLPVEIHAIEGVSRS